MAELTQRLKLKLADLKRLCDERGREIERLKAEVQATRDGWQSALVLRDEVWKDKLEKAAYPSHERLSRAEAKLTEIHLACAAYPIKCPDCGYEWRAGLTGLAALAASPEHGEEVRRG